MDPNQAKRELLLLREQLKDTDEELTGSLGISLEEEGGEQAQKERMARGETAWYLVDIHTLLDYTEYLEDRIKTLKRMNRPYEHLIAGNILLGAIQNIPPGEE